MRNGAGKTTAMRAVFGLTALDSGTVRWNGALVTQSGRRRFGYLPEERGLYPGMRAAEQLEYLGRLHGLSPAVAAAAAAGWLERLGVGDRAGTKVESLSLGNQQRVQLASALVHNPDLLILDEPLSGLDPAGIDAVGEILASQARVIPALLSNRADIERVGVAGQLSAPVRAAVLADGPATGTRVELVAEPSRQAAAADLRSGRIGLAIVDGRQVVVAKAAAGTSASSLLPQAVARTVGPGAALQAAGLTPAQAAAIAGARALPVTSLEPGGPGTTQRNATFVGLLLLVFMLTQYNAWTLTGVLEEKSSRIVEVLLAAITLARLLAGKVLGIGLAAFVQAGLAVATAVALAEATHSGALAGIMPEAVASTLTWLVLGYAFYSWVYATAGSTADRLDQAQSLLLPLGLPVIFGYLMATTTITSGNPSAFFHALAYLPPTAPFAMPVLVSLGAASWWQFAMSAAISVACTAGIARLAIAVCRKSILQAGRRVPLRELLTR